MVMVMVNGVLPFVLLFPGICIHCLLLIKFGNPTFQLFMLVDLHRISPTHAFGLPICKK